MLSINLERCWL